MCLFCFRDNIFWWFKILDQPKVTFVTFWLSNVTFKGQKYYKIPILLSCMSNIMFLGSRNPNLAKELHLVHSKVTVVTFQPANVTFKGQKYHNIPILVSCMSNIMFFWSRNPNLAIELHSVHSKVTFVTFQPANVTFKGQIMMKIFILTSWISIVMFLGSRNPNFTSKLYFDCSKVTYVTFGFQPPTFMTFKGQIYHKIPILPSCKQILCFNRKEIWFYE